MRTGRPGQDSSGLPLPIHNFDIDFHVAYERRRKMDKNLCTLIDTASKALEAEDRYLLGAVTANKQAFGDSTGGILRFNNERYYQFVIARALMSSFPFKTDLEVETHDLVFQHLERTTKWAVVEIKRWMSATGESEIPGIRHDVDHKLKKADAEHRMMLIISANPTGKTEKNLEFLSERLKSSVLPLADYPDRWYFSKFETVDTEGKGVEFWVAGIEI